MAETTRAEFDWKFTVDHAEVARLAPLMVLAPLRDCSDEFHCWPVDLDWESREFKKWRYFGTWKPGHERLGRIALQRVMHYYWPDRFPAV